MKYTPRKVYIKESGGYTEIDYDTFCLCREADNSYADKWFIPVQGCLLETTPEQYVKFYKEAEHLKYLYRLDRKYGLLSMDALDTENENGTSFIPAESQGVEEQFEQKMEKERLRICMCMLPEKERLLLHERFFKEITQTELADLYGVNQSTICRRIRKALNSLRSLMDS